ncbi:MAG: glycosyltransferase, partial [Pyrinomonadaceae bacterium]
MVRFAWRFARNLLCIMPWGRNLLFPAQSLASDFGPGDADYAISVFLRHYRQLSASGFHAVDSILEVGPGRNLGTALLMWALNRSRSVGAVSVMLWDVFPNLAVDANSVRTAARALLQSPKFPCVLEVLPDNSVQGTLDMVAREELLPAIRYRVQPLKELIASGEASNVALVYSQAVIEHIWNVGDFWKTVIRLTKTDGWHSHRIDLADHGRRETNYIEMLEWSPVSYWLTMRFVPGAINRWRASVHLNYVVQSGLNILSANRETRDALPIPRTRINRKFRSMDELDLRTTAVDLVAVKTSKTKSQPSVLMFCTQFRPTIGGAERQAEKLAVALTEAGCRVTILTPRVDPDSPDREEVNGVIIERLRLTDLSLRHPVQGVAIFNIPYLMWQIKRAMKLHLEGTHILHCHNASLLTAGAALAGWMASVPV